MPAFIDRLIQMRTRSVIYCSLQVMGLEEAPQYIVQVDNDDAPFDHVTLCNDKLLPVTNHVYSVTQIHTA